MAFRDGTFRSRAASLLRPGTPSTSHSLSLGATQEEASGSALKTPTKTQFNEKTPIGAEQNPLEKTRSLTSSGHTHYCSDSNAVAHDREAQRIVRTIPGETLSAYFSTMGQSASMPLPLQSLTYFLEFSLGAYPRRGRRGIGYRNTLITRLARSTGRSTQQHPILQTPLQIRSIAGQVMGSCARMDPSSA